MLQRTLVIAVLAGLLAGCVLPGTPAMPTPYPPGFLPTVIYLTAQSIDAATRAASSPTPEPTSSATPTPATPAPSATPTPGPGIPLAAIQIRAPGPMSRVVSPMQVQMLVKAGDSNVVHVNLFGEDGRYLDGTLKAVAGSPDGDPLLLKVPFEIRAAGENGFIQVSTDDIHHRPQSLITVPVLLLSSGESQINPAGNTIYERVAFSHLRPDSEVSGGILKAEGELMPYSRQPFIMELATDEGRVLGTRLVPVSGTDWQSFSTTIPYKVDKRTSARLYVHEADDVLNGPAYIYSQPMTLLP